MNLDRVRERLSAAEVRTVFNHQALIVYEFPGDTPPNHANDMIAMPGESNADVFKRYGVEIPRGKHPPCIRIALNWRGGYPVQGD